MYLQLDAGTNEVPCWEQGWKARSAYGTAFSVSALIRSFDFGAWANIGASMAMGFCLQSFLEIGHERASLARVRNWSATHFGQMAIFGLSQLFANTSNPSFQKGIVDAIIALFSINATISLRKLYEEKMVQVDATAVSQRTERTATLVLSEQECVPHRAAHALKIAASVFLAATSYFLPEEPSRGCASFFSLFYLAQVIGEKMIDAVDRKIDSLEIVDPLSLSDWKARPFQIAKMVLLTFAYLGQIACFAPLLEANSLSWLQIASFGVPLGFFNGVSDRSRQRRAAEVPLSDMKELDPIPLPESKFGATAWKIWKRAIDVLALSSVSAFTFWQLTSLKETQDRIVLGCLLAGFATTYTAGRFIDETWKKDCGSAWKNRSLYALWFSFRVLGINPLYCYWICTHLMQMNSQAEASLKEVPLMILSGAGWLSYGISMASELVKNSSERRGDLQGKYAAMAMIDGASTLLNALKGRIPV